MCAEKREPKLGKECSWGVYNRDRYGEEYAGVGYCVSNLTTSDATPNTDKKISFLILSTMGRNCSILSHHNQ